MKPLFKKTTFKPWLPSGLTFLSAVLVVLSFPPWNLWPLLWIALVPWFASIRKTSTLQGAAIQGFWLGYFMSLGGFYWVAFVLKEFGNVPWLLSFLGLQLFCTVGQLQFIVIAPLLKWLDTQKKSSFLAIFVALFYTGTDWIAPKLFKDTLGHGLYLATHLRQVADLGGATLLTFLIYFVNDTLWNLVKAFKKRRQLSSLLSSPFSHASINQLGIALVLILSSLIYGSYRYQMITQTVQNTKTGIQTAAIQGNIGDIDKLAAERGLVGAANKVLDTFMSLSDEAMKMNPRPEVIIWPETSYPSTFRNPHSNSEISLDLQLENYREQLGIPLLFGGYDHSSGKDFNAFFFLSPKGELEIYQKNILLLFGEYIPGADEIDYLKNAFPQVGNFGRGKGPSVLTVQSSRPEVGTVHIGPLICYEALFPNYVIDAARQGSQIIMNITNDSWFGNWGEPQLHLALSVFRSIETRLPMLRSTNTGISALILPNGEITHATRLNTKEVMNVFIPTTPAIPTLMKALGDWFGLFALLVGLLGLIQLRKKA